MCVEPGHPQLGSIERAGCRHQLDRLPLLLPERLDDPDSADRRIDDSGDRGLVFLGTVGGCGQQPAAAVGDQANHGYQQHRKQRKRHRQPGHDRDT